MTPPPPPDATADVLGRFSGPTQDWFRGAFAEPTAAQAGAWDAVSTGRHALVVAPTGSGKTLAAFLWALDRIVAEPAPEDADPVERCRVLYVSPLKALATDVERNLRSPLVGVRQAATRRGVTLPEVRVGVRTGDTPPNERRAFATKPPDILITTPESLFLVLTSGARAGLSGVRTVILDEIHAVAGTKRGAHLAVSLERLDALLDRPGGPGPAQRVGLSATVTPVDRVAAFLAGGRAPADGGREVVVVQPPSSKEIRVDVVVPVPDLTDLGAPLPDDGSRHPAPPDGVAPLAPGERDLTGQAAAEGGTRPSIWPHVEERVVDLVAEHRSTLVFTNSRRGAERLTARMNEVWAERRGEDVPDPGELWAAQVTAQSGTAVGVDTRDARNVLARAHHGSMSRAERTRTESELKAGRLPAVVATSSLELGIDMGAVDLVVQVGAPPSAASGLQRIGRAGHQVGAVSHGVVFPTFRGDLVPAAVTALRMRAGQIEPVAVPQNPLDVLAQQVVAMVATEDWTVAELAAVVRRAAPFATLGDATLRAVLDMLAGRYPSEEFGELRPRVVWDRATDVLTARPGALRLAVTSGGTIPDRGLYGVFLASGAETADVPVDPERSGGRTRGGKRVGELDEEMVYESRVGDTFTLGSSTWRIEDITPDRVLVTPAPGVPGRLPFWKGDSQGRPASLGRAMGAWAREVADLPDAAARDRVREAGLDDWAADNLLGYLREQRAATGALPSDVTVVVERFRDELGDWRVVVHSPFGARVHAPWALVLGARLRERFGVDAAAMHADDGIVLRLPDMLAAASDPVGDLLGWSAPDAWSTDGTAASAPGGLADPVPVDAADLLIEPDEVAEAVRAELGGSAMFGARFREAAARALLLPRRRPDRRQPLWQQRQRSAQLLSVASRYPEFPILLEAVRECLQDDFDIDALVELMRDVSAGRVRVVEVTTARPSPFAQSLLFGYTAQFLYDGDAPLAERRAAALTLDPTLLDELLGGGGGSQVADLLDPDAVLRTEAELMGTDPDRQARTAEQVADVLRRHGPLPLAGVEARTREDVRGEVAGWLADLEHARRLIRVRISGVPAERAEQWAAVEDAGRLRDALGVALPVGVPEVFTEVLPDPLGDLLRRHARTHGPFTAAHAAARFGLGTAVVQSALRPLERAGVVVQGRLRPDALGGVGDEYCDADVLRTLRRRSLAALRSEVEPVPQVALGRFLPAWQHATGRPGPGALRGVDGLARAVEQLAGAVLPASALETLVLPARVPDYSPALLDELTAAGEVLWAGHGTLPGKDGLVSLHLAATADLTLPLVPAPGAEVTPAEHLGTPLHRALVDALRGGGAYFLGALGSRAAEGLETPPSQAALVDALWDLVWAGLVTNDGLAPLRARLAGGRTTHRTSSTSGPSPRARALTMGRYGGRPSLRGSGLGLRGGGLGGGVPGPGLATAGGEAGGRWSMLPAREPDPTRRGHALAAQLLDRHGVLTRAVAPAEGVAGQFAAVYRVLAALEQAGQVRRGYFVEHLGGSQFALPGAVDQLRADARQLERLAEQSVPADADRSVVLLAATDPANPYGAALGWPVRPDAPTGHRPGRKAGGVVVLVDGTLALYLERGGRTVLSFAEDEQVLRLATDRLAEAVRDGRLGRVTLVRGDGEELLHTTGTALGRALAAAGFAPTPRGLRLRGVR
ncbi:DEAD/DEAH box helicase [Cellulomonas hominis]|uniref:ATP-dependent Lhr-like helicase n=1 Tax=Cellulomonas hominis TaxID=156981 RepID=A0A511F8G8_9CELL|nr:DEAD/DEAH box helicase [Cellulomonas hominis]MBB5474371.1 ATP-dependent Lhr-like helicase [Cellulomonas hominis]GEL45542.1 DEAD/DEAH box helicase [Cellulomonas hominis]